MASIAGTPGLIIAAGVGAAASTALEPAFEAPRQDAWSRNANRILNVDTLARLAAMGGVVLGNTDGSTSGTAYEEARRQGFTSDKLDRLIYLAQRVPSISEARAMRRRYDPATGAPLISQNQLRHVYTKEALDPQYWDALDQLVNDILSPGELAAAIHRGLVPDPQRPDGSPLLLGEQPQPPFNVEAYPVYPIDAAREAAGSGYDVDRLGVLVGLQGLPMGTHEAAQAYFRGIITHGDYIRAFNESNSRNEWAQAVLDYTRQIPTARDFMENALRGHHDFEWAAQQAARHGMSRDDAFLIYQNQGRPLNLHQITQGLAWGATYNPAPTDNPDPWMQAVLLGPVRPEYYDLQHALKYNLPSAFYFRTLQEQGVLTEAEAVTWYKRLGWPPELAEKVASAYAQPAETKANPFIGRAQTQLWTALHKAYVKEGTIDQATADSYLTNLIDSATDRAVVLELWTTEKNVGAAAGPPAV